MNKILSYSPARTLFHWVRQATIFFGVLQPFTRQGFLYESFSSQTLCSKSQHQKKLGEQRARSEPVVAGWEAQTLPLCFADCTHRHATRLFGRDSLKRSAPGCWRRWRGNPGEGIRTRSCTRCRRGWRRLPTTSRRSRRSWKETGKPQPLEPGIKGALLVKLLASRRPICR